MNNDIRKPVLLTIHLGYTFDDLQQVSNNLERLVINRIICNLFKPEEYNNVLSLIKNHKIDAIETRHVRYWQENLDKFQLLMDSIETLARENSIPMLNSPEIFRWIGNKGKYLSELEQRGVTIVPTKFLHPGEQFDIVEHIKDKKHGVVVKPSFAAKAYGLEFIKHTGDKDKLFSVEVPQAATQYTSSHRKVELFNEQELLEHFANYLKQYRGTEMTKEQVIIIQELIPDKIETACMYIRGCNPYFIKRTEGELSGIAHEAFGGENIPEENPPQELHDFALSIKGLLPDNVKNEPILRFDIFTSSDKKLRLLEIEAASLRLFTTKTNITEYATMLANVAKQSYELFTKHDSRANAVNPNLAPSAKILP
jgi:glutathione synthase/RimK-type ligase-like ATP-grasp enzyme